MCDDSRRHKSSFASRNEIHADESRLLPELSSDSPKESSGHARPAPHARRTIRPGRGASELRRWPPEGVRPLVALKAAPDGRPLGLETGPPLAATPAVPNRTSRPMTAAPRPEGAGR